MSFQRQELLNRLFPNGVPTLWCPTLTFFRDAHRQDEARIEEHLTGLSQFVRGILVPGSTGEGWEMNDDEIQQLLRIVLPIAERLRMHVLVGILKTQTDQVLAAIDALQDCIEHPATTGITVCAAKGADLSQDTIEAGLATVLARGIPTALYQLPQVTENEMAPATVERLAARFANFVMLKDTSGLDHVAHSDANLDGVFLVRGAERGGYAPFLRANGGRYDGFLLSTANVFAPELAGIIADSQSGQAQHAHESSKRLAEYVAKAFEVVSTFTVGNPFTNTNKVLDHLRRHGSNWRTQPTPMLISGVRIPIEIIEAVSQIR